MSLVSDKRKQALDSIHKSDIFFQSAVEPETRVSQISIIILENKRKLEI